MTWHLKTFTKKCRARFALANPFNRAFSYSLWLCASHEHLSSLRLGVAFLLPEIWWNLPDPPATRQTHEAQNRSTWISIASHRAAMRCCLVAWTVGPCWGPTSEIFITVHSVVQTCWVGKRHFMAFCRSYKIRPSHFVATTRCTNLNIRVHNVMIV